MLKRIRHFLGIYTKDEKFTNGYNTMVEAIKDKDWDLMRDLYFSSVDNDFDFDDFAAASARLCVETDGQSIFGTA